MNTVDLSLSDIPDTSNGPTGVCNREVSWYSYMLLPVLHYMHAGECCHCNYIDVVCHDTKR